MVFSLNGYRVKLVYLLKSKHVGPEFYQVTEQGEGMDSGENTCRKESNNSIIYEYTDKLFLLTFGENIKNDEGYC